jgi:hypothetical protein
LCTRKSTNLFFFQNDLNVNKDRLCIPHVSTNWKMYTSLFQILLFRTSSETACQEIVGCYRQPSGTWQKESQILKDLPCMEAVQLKLAVHHFFIYKPCRRCYLPWVIEYCELTVIGCCMGCSSKNTNMHTVTRQNRWWEVNRLPICSPYP